MKLSQDQRRIRNLWRKRLARNLRRFKRIKGRWPDLQIIEASKNAIDQAAYEGVLPPYEH